MHSQNNEYVPSRDLRHFIRVPQAPQSRTDGSLIVVPLANAALVIVREISVQHQFERTWLQTRHSHRVLIQHLQISR
jgi:hypothetical protein